MSTLPGGSPDSGTAIEAGLRAAALCQQAGPRGAAEAEAILQDLLARYPGQPAVHRAMAQLAAGTGRAALALRHMTAAHQLSPTSIELRFQLGCLLAHDGQYIPALEHFQATTAARPDLVEGWHFLGITLGRLRRDGEALHALHRAHALSRKAGAPNPGTLRALADLEFRVGHPANAFPLWEELLRVQPDDLEVRLKTGESLSRMGAPDRARVIYTEGLERQPHSPELWLALGQAAEDDGDRDAAGDAYRRALEFRPEWPFALGCLLGLLRAKAPMALIDEATSLLAHSGLSDQDRALLGYALGKVHDGQGAHALALGHWRDANAARQRATAPPDPAPMQQQVDRIIDAFRPELFDGTSIGSDDDRFVFVVGMPRSGTTLTEQIIAAHPQAHGCGELPDIGFIAYGFTGPHGLWPAFPDMRALLGRDALQAAARRYAEATERHAPSGAKRLVDKEPLNFFHLGLVALLFPRARIIWCRRDPRDIALSIYGENFALEETLATDWAGIGHYINLQHRLMRHWQQVLPLPILESTYESLVSSPEPQARRITDFLDLPWNPDCLDFHRNQHGIQSPSRWQVRQPVHTRSVGRWRHYEADMGPLLDVLAPDAFP